MTILPSIAWRGERRSSGSTRAPTVALNPPPAASGALIAFGLGYVQALADEGRALDAFALKDAMEATNAARASHGDGLGGKAC